MPNLGDVADSIPVLTKPQSSLLACLIITCSGHITAIATMSMYVNTKALKPRNLSM